MEDRELLAKVNETNDFFGSVLQRDNLDDWNLAKDFGEFMIRLDPAEAMGHALLARAYRHLGDSQRALEELARCRASAMHTRMKPPEAELFFAFLAEEEKLLSRGSALDATQIK